MANVVVFMLWEAGHLLPTMKLSRDLARRGHKITYVTIPDLTGLVCSRGFGAVPILADFFPWGSNGRVDFWPEEQRPGIWAGLERCAREEVIESQIEALEPDIVLVDSLFFRTHAECLRRRGMRVLIVSTSLPHEPKGGLPRLDSPRLPRGPISNRLAISYSWIEFLAGQWWQYFFRRVPMTIPKLGVTTDEIILCPEELDFPRPNRPRRYYIGPSVEMDRPLEEFPWGRLTEGAKLIYCCLGTQAYRYPAFRELASSLVAAVSQRTDEQLMLVGNQGAVENGGPLPDNVIVVDHAPQIELLGRASVAITHAGLGSVKECILMGVPMIVFPQAFDQPGNAARIEYHRLGFRCIEPPFDGACVRRLLDSLSANPEILENVRRMQGVFRVAEDDNRGVRVIEHLLADGQPALARAQTAAGDRVLGGSLNAIPDMEPTPGDQRRAAVPPVLAEHE
jgi:MGT family glycosyltransferase